MYCAPISAISSLLYYMANIFEHHDQVKCYILQIDLHRDTWSNTSWNEDYLKL